MLVTNHQFSRQQLLPSHWQVLALFPDESYDCQAEYPLSVAGKPLEPRSADLMAESGRVGDSLWRRVRQLVAQWPRRRRIKRFAAACTKMEEALGLRDGDQVFIPTASLFDLLGLVHFLQTRIAPVAVVWHACFHYGFLQGREPQYVVQSAQEEKIRRQLQYLVEIVPESRLRFYATTKKLAHQFNRLGMAHFDVLPFPVDYRALQQGDLAPAPRQLRLTCAGYLRREKGKMWASTLVQRLWESELSPGHVQLVVQTNQRQARRMLPRGKAAAPRFRASVRGVGREPIIWLHHPLTREAYLELIRESDIALFLHDGRAYYTRCSGVLVEMLAAGVPVLVPAGSWLAEQVAEPIYAHRDGLASQATCLLEGPPGQIGWRRLGGEPLATASPSELVVGGASCGAVCEVPIPPSASVLLLSWQWQSDAGTGTYLRVSADQIGSVSPPATSILSYRPTNPCVSTLIQLDPGVSRVGLRIQNAFDDSPITLSTTKISYLTCPAQEPATYPAGSVGLVFADVEELPRLVREHAASTTHTTARRLCSSRINGDLGMMPSRLWRHCCATGAI